MDVEAMVVGRVIEAYGIRWVVLLKTKADPPCYLASPLEAPQFPCPVFSVLCSEAAFVDGPPPAPPPPAACRPPRKGKRSK